MFGNVSLRTYFLDGFMGTYFREFVLGNVLLGTDRRGIILGNLFLGTGSGNVFAETYFC